MTRPRCSDGVARSTLLQLVVTARMLAQRGPQPEVSELPSTPRPVSSCSSLSIAVLPEQESSIAVEYQHSCPLVEALGSVICDAHTGTADAFLCWSHHFAKAAETKDAGEGDGGTFGGGAGGVGFAELAHRCGYFGEGVFEGGAVGGGSEAFEEAAGGGGGNVACG